MAAPVRSSGGFEPGDVLVSLTHGAVQWWRADGTYVTTFTTQSDGKAEGMGFDANGHLFVTQWYSEDLASGNRVTEFDATTARRGTFGAGYDCNPRSITFDADGHAF